jgi:hypothetical protein
MSKIDPRFESVHEDVDASINRANTLLRLRNET